MSKTALKEKIRRTKANVCMLTGEELPEETALFDTHRLNPKRKGGIYTDQNTIIADPVAHMKEHFIFRERSPEIEELKIMIDGREHIRKFVNSLNNRLLASKRRTDKLDSVTQDWIKHQIKEAQSQLGKTDRRIEKYMKSLDMPIVHSALGIRGLGAITVAYMLTYVDINKAKCASAMWSYTGLDKPSHERYTKGESGGGNKTLRTVLYTMADSMIKTRSVYRDVYDNEKRKLEASERIVKSRNTQGKLIECMWKDAKPCHRHGAAIRKLIKHFLADFWYVWRTQEGLPTRPLYVEEYLGHTGIIRPEERGWKY